MDSLNASVGEQVLIRYALQLRDRGMNAKEIADALEQVKGRIVLLGVVDTLEYLLKGGRISKVWHSNITKHNMRLYRFHQFQRSFPLDASPTT